MVSKIKSILERERPDIIHTNSWNGFAFKRSVPLVVSEHLVVHDDAGANGTDGC